MICYLYCIFVCTNELFPFVILMFLVVAFSFSLREVTLTFFVKLVSIFWVLYYIIFLLPLWEILQDQQVGLTQAPFKLLLLPWVPEGVRLCMCCLSVCY